MPKIRFFSMNLLLFLSFITLSHAKEESSYELIPDKNELKILNPDISKRTTAKLRLKNGLEAYIISDPGADQSAAALAVEVGSWSDPETYPGTAHFLEHMLFMGNAAYPDEEGFFTYVIDNNGNLNAYTASDRTVYMFSTANESFEGGLDRFSHFFIDPLFNPSGIGRELHAVDQENDKNIENDSWRNLMIFKETGNQDHPNAKFSTGNAETLGKIPQRILKDWFENNYSANRMHLVVYSPLPIDQLKALVSEDFSKIPNTNAPKPEYLGNLSSETQLKHMIYINPIKDLRNLSIIWELPPELSTDMESKTAQLVAFALGNGNETGLLETLKKEGLVESLDVGVDNFSQKNALFVLNIDLTKKGLENTNPIIERCFQAISHYRENGIPLFLFNEMRTMAKTDYQYQSRSNAFAFVMHHAHQLIEEPIETYPKKTIMASSFNLKKTKKLLSLLNPENCFFVLNAPSSLIGVESTNKERWLGGEYTMRRLPDEQITFWSRLEKHPSLTSPTSNNLIPTNLKIQSNAKMDPDLLKPKLISEDEYGKAYFAEDPKYRVPETIMLFNFKSPIIDGSPKQIALLDLYIKCIEDKLAPIIFKAHAANLHLHFSQSKMRLNLTLNGYSEKASEFFKQILLSIKNYVPTENKFHIYKDFLLSDYDSQEKSMPFLQAGEILSNLIYNDAPSSERIANSLKEISFEDFSKFHEKLFTSLFIEGMFVGNLPEVKAKNTWQNIKDILSPGPFSPLDHNTPSVLLLPDENGPFMVFEKTPMQGNAVLLMLQEGPFSFEKRASQLILEKALSQAFFATLRTQQQTAYIAKSWAKEVHNQLLHFFAVQSSTHNPHELIARFELFLEGYDKDFETNISEERFNLIRDMLISLLLKPLPNLENYAARIHKFAFTDQGDFDRVQKQVNSLQELTYQQFKEDTKTFLTRKNGKRLAILLEGIISPDKNFQYKSITTDSLREIGIYASDKDFFTIAQ